MPSPPAPLRAALFAGAACLLAANAAVGQPLPPPVPEQAPAPQPDVPRGVEVQARGPVHEAFATPTAEPRPTPPIARQPPAPLEEMPPEERPEGDVVWVPGYWAFDDDRQEYLWVSGCWRVKPDGKEWIGGYWREIGSQWQWVPGFWAVSRDGRAQEVTYFPQPPAPPNVAPPGTPPGPDAFYVPGSWVWSSRRYVWRAGYWGRVRPGYVYVADHYRWTPHGYVHVAGYWDYAVARRGLLYAPVIVDPALVGVRFVYTPRYAVTDALVLDALFVRPAHCHYYFGDYYGPRYSRLGFESCVVYSRRRYEPLIAYRRWEHRDNPRWLDVQVNLTLSRHAGRAPVPPRTLVQQNVVVHNVTNVTNVTVNNVQRTQVLVPARNVLAARGAKTVPLDSAARTQVQQSTRAVQHAAVTERRKAEAPVRGQGVLTKPRTTALNVPVAPTAARATAQPALPPQGGFGRPTPAGPTTPGLTKNPPIGSPTPGVATRPIPGTPRNTGPVPIGTPTVGRPGPPVAPQLKPAIPAPGTRPTTNPNRPPPVNPTIGGRPGNRPPARRPPEEKKKRG